MKNLHKHFQKIVTGYSKARPILNGIHYKEDGKIVATDSHRLLQVNIKHEIKNKTTINPLTFETYEQEYPNTDKLIPSKGERVIIDQESLQQLFTLFKTTKKHDFVDLHFNNDSIDFELENKLKTTIYIGTHNIDIDTMRIRAMFLKEATDFLTDTELNKIELLFVSKLRPLLFTVEDQFDYLITPIRR